MKLDEILALHPQGADATTVREAIIHAKALRTELLAQAEAHEKFRATSLLVAEEKVLRKAETDAATARLDAERIAALLPAMEAEWKVTAGAETLAELRAGVGTVEAAVAELREWQATEFEQMRRMMAKGFRLQDVAEAALRQYRDRVADEYLRQEVRDAGPLGVAVPNLPGNLPRQQFPNWS